MHGLTAGSCPVAIEVADRAASLLEETAGLTQPLLRALAAITCSRYTPKHCLTPCPRHIHTLGHIINFKVLFNIRQDAGGRLEDLEVSSFVAGLLGSADRRRCGSY